MLGLNPGLLRLWHWQPDALATNYVLCAEHSKNTKNTICISRVYIYRSIFTVLLENSLDPKNNAQKKLKLGVKKEQNHCTKVTYTGLH
jgi:hypothetical protein